MSITFAQLVQPAFRKAGIVKLSGTGPGTDMYNEAIPALNRMMSSLNLVGSYVYSSGTVRGSLVPGQRDYTLGPTGSFSSTRPLWIISANLLLVGTDPEINISLGIIRDLDTWSNLTLPGLETAFPTLLYSTRAMPTDTIQLWPVPSVAYDLELYVRTAVKDNFTATTDTADLPPGYEEAIVNNFAIELDSLYGGSPFQTSNLRPGTRELAAKALRRIAIMQSTSPMLIGDATNLNGQRPDDLDRRINFISGGQA